MRRQAQRVDAPNQFARNLQGLAAGSHQVNPWTVVQYSGGEGSRFANHMLAVVNDDQTFRLAQRCHKSVEWGLTRLRAQSEAFQGRVRHQSSIGYRREVDERHGTPEIIMQPCAEDDRQASLADSSRPYQRDQCRLGHESCKLVNFGLATDKARRLVWKPPS